MPVAPPFVSPPPSTTASSCSSTATTTTQCSESVSQCQRRFETLQSRYAALESRVQQRINDIESKYQQRIDELEQKVKQIEWQPDNRLPRRINRNFTILAELGTGQRAIVYKCINRGNNMHVALKVALEPTEPNVVRNDALMIHRIGWRYLIRIYGSSESLDDPTEMKQVDAIEMRLFQCTLKSDLQAFDRGTRPQRTPAFCLQHLDGLLKELITCHTKGVVHCDIKPDNVLWSDDEQRYVLVEFGHAIVADDHMAARRGTTQYSAPEALGCCNVRDRWATRGDVWSLGLTLMYVCSSTPRRPVFSVDGCCDDQQRRSKVSKAIVEYLKRGKDERRQWLSQQLHIEEPKVMSSMVDLLLRMICEPECRWEMDDVRSHQLWSLV